MAMQLVVLMPRWIRSVKQRPALLMQLGTASQQCRMLQCLRQNRAPRPCQVMLNHHRFAAKYHAIPACRALAH